MHIQLPQSTKPLDVESLDKNLNYEYRKKATDEQYFTEVLFITLCTPVLTFESVDEILMCDFKGYLVQYYFHRI